MRLHIIPRILAATCLLCGNATSSTAQLANETRAEIEATSRALIAAQLRYDAPAVARLLTKDFVYVGDDGSFTAKSGFLPTADDRKRRSLELLEWKLKQVQFYGDTAVALYLVHEKNISNGKPHEFQGCSLATWIKREGHWLCAAIHD